MIFALLKRPKLLAPIVAFVGMVGAWGVWGDHKVRSEIHTDGVETVASVGTMTRTTGRRGQPQFQIGLTWTDQSGNSHSVVRGISKAFAESIVKDGLVMRQTVKLKYLADRPGQAVVLDDFGVAKGEIVGVWLFAAMGFGGLVATVWLFARRRRHPDLNAATLPAR